MSVSRVGAGSPRDWIRQNARRKGPNVARLSDCRLNSKLLGPRTASGIL